jgi:hypothetical protein
MQLSLFKEGFAVFGPALQYARHEVVAVLVQTGPCLPD